MINEKPTTAFIVSLLGGIFVLLGGLIWAAVGTVVAIFTFGIGFLLYVFLLFGIIIIAGSVAFNNSPRTAHTWGIVILILGIFSLVGVITALGGILSIVGGALALSWHPSQQGPPPPPGQYY
jgi:hypothetical protein